MNSWCAVMTGIQHLFIHCLPPSPLLTLFPQLSFTFSQLIVREFTRLLYSHLSNRSNVIPIPSSFFVHFCPVCHGISLPSLPLCAACSCMAQAEALKSTVCFNECISELLCVCCCRFRGVRALQCYLAPGSCFSLTFFLYPLYKFLLLSPFNTLSVSISPSLLRCLSDFVFRSCSPSSSLHSYFLYIMPLEQDFCLSCTPGKCRLGLMYKSSPSRLLFN